MYFNYSKHNFVDAAQEIVADHKINDEQLNEDDFINLTLAVLNDMGQDQILAISESDELYMVMHHLKKFMQTAKPEYAMDLAVTLETIVMNKYANFIKELFNDLAPQIQIERAA